MKRRIILLIISSLFLALFLCSCGKDKNANESSNAESASNIESTSAEDSEVKEEVVVVDPKDIIADFSTPQKFLEEYNNNVYYGYVDKNGNNYASIYIRDLDTALTEFEYMGKVYPVINLQGLEAASGYTSFEVPENILHLGDFSFQDNETLVSVKIHENVSSIGKFAFDDCVNLKEINIPDKVTSIGEYTFRNCQSIEEIKIPDTITSIGFGAFQLCVNLKGVKIPESVTEMGRAMFIDCDGIISVGPTGSGASVEIPENYTEISGFTDCANLTTITIPNGVEEIGEYAFQDNPNLTTLNIPDSLAKIGLDAFIGSNISTITYRGNTYSSVSEFEEAFLNVDGNTIK